jgi:hypothetical protein
MPIVGTGQIAAQVVKAAEDAVRATWLAKNKILSATEQQQMLLEIRAAGLEALFVHFAANALVAGTATGVTAGPAAVPVVGTVA